MDKKADYESKDLLSRARLSLCNYAADLRGDARRIGPPEIEIGVVERLISDIDATAKEQESKSIASAARLEPHEAQMLLDLALQTLNGVDPAPQDAVILDKLEDIAKGTEYQSKDRARVEKLLHALKERAEGDVVSEEYLIELENMLWLAPEHQSVARDPDAWLIEHDGVSTATCSAKIAKTASRDGGTVRPLYLADDMECGSSTGKDGEG